MGGGVVVPVSIIPDVISFCFFAMAWRAADVEIFLERGDRCTR